MTCYRKKEIITQFRYNEKTRSNAVFDFLAIVHMFLARSRLFSIEHSNNRHSILKPTWNFYNKKPKTKSGRNERKTKVIHHSCIITNVTSIINSCSSRIFFTSGRCCPVHAWMAYFRERNALRCSWRARRVARSYGERIFIIYCAELLSALFKYINGMINDGAQLKSGGWSACTLAHCARRCVRVRRRRDVMKCSSTRRTVPIYSEYMYIILVWRWVRGRDVKLY